MINMEDGGWCLNNNDILKIFASYIHHQHIDIDILAFGIEFFADFWKQPEFYQAGLVNPEDWSINVLSIIVQPKQSNRKYIILII